MKTGLRRILVPLDPSRHAESALRTACFIAKRHRASVSSVAVLDSEEIRASLIPAIGPYFPLMADEIQKKVAHADERLREVLAKAGAVCAECEVEHRATEYEGIPAEKLMASSIFHDLVVVGLRTSFHFETRGIEGESLHGLLDHTAAPLLAVPEAPMEKLRRVHVAFDGSPSAARALRDFMPIAAPFQPEIALVVADMPTDQSDFLLGQAELFLRDHGFSQISREAAPEPVEEAFDRILASGSDLLVLGMQARKAIRDFFTGNFTRTMIERGDTALLLSH